MPSGPKPSNTRLTRFEDLNSKPATAMQSAIRDCDQIRGRRPMTRLLSRRQPQRAERTPPRLRTRFSALRLPVVEDERTRNPGVLRVTQEAPSAGPNSRMPVRREPKAAAEVASLRRRRLGQQRTAEAA